MRQDLMSKAKDGSLEFFKRQAAETGITALSIAITLRDAEIVRALLQTGAIVNATDLILAEKAGNTEVVELLKKTGDKK